MIHWKEWPTNSLSLSFFWEYKNMKINVNYCIKHWFLEKTSARIFGECERPEPSWELSQRIQWKWQNLLVQIFLAAFSWILPNCARLLWEEFFFLIFSTHSLPFQSSSFIYDDNKKKYSFYVWWRIFSFINIFILWAYESSLALSLKTEKSICLGPSGFHHYDHQFFFGFLVRLFAIMDFPFHNILDPVRFGIYSAA